MNIPFMKRKATPDNVYGRIARKQEVLARINEIRHELTDLSGKRVHIEAKLMEDKSALQGLTDEYVEKFPDAKARKESLIRNVAQRREVLDDIKRQTEALEQERQHLKDVELPKCHQKTTVAEVLAHQDSLKAMREEAKRISDAMAAQSEIMRAAEASIVSAPDRGAQRAEVLANIAMGDATKKDLDDLELLIATEREANEKSVAKSKPVYLQAAETLGGLVNKETELKQRIEAKERATAMVMEQFLMSEITDLAGQYVHHAQALKEAFYRLLALEKLLVTATGSGRNIMPFSLQIPLPNLEEFRDLALNNEPSLMLTFRPPWNGDNVVSPWVAAERERLVGEGCELL